MSKCDWWQLRCQYKTKKEEKAAIEQAAEQEKWDALDYIPDNLDEQVATATRTVAYVGLPVLLILAFALRKPKTK